MRKGIAQIFLIGCLSGPVLAQIGINNPNPTAALDVMGSTWLERKLYLENPGDYSEIRGSKLLIQKTNGEIVKYDIDVSKYGPINYIELVFRKTNTAGLQNYDTKISAQDYLVTVQGFYFLANGTNSTNLTVRSNSNDKIEGFQVYAYINEVTQTWHIKGFVNNSKFQNDSYSNVPIDLYMNLIIYRNGFIAKPLDDIPVNMGNQSTKTIDPPAGF